MKRGKTIQIYLLEGNPRGIKICEITSGIAKGILIPRNQLKEASLLQELNQTGVYFLFSEKDSLSQFKTYIGEAENPIKRLIQHDTLKEKIDWNYAICFISSKDNLNKAHVKFLENYSYNLVSKNGVSQIVNNTIPNKPAITKQEEDLIMDFFEELKLLLSTLGYSLFEKPKRAKSKEEVFYCKETVAYATGNLTEEGFIVYKNSKTKLKEAKSAGIWTKNIRSNLIEKGILVKQDDVFVFTQDFMFNSPSTAATTILARRANGWVEWKNKENNKTLDEIKRKKEV